MNEEQEVSVLERKWGFLPFSFFFIMLNTNANTKLCLYHSALFILPQNSTQINIYVFIL